MRGSALYAAIGNTYYIFRQDKSGQESYSVWQETLGQYTGVDDKTGKPIYEGDIIEERARDGYCYGRYVMVWDGDYSPSYAIIPTNKFSMSNMQPNKHNMDSSDIYTSQMKYTQVIGNIYDNPELLEVTE